MPSQEQPRVAPVQAFQNDGSNQHDYSSGGSQQRETVKSDRGQRKPTSASRTSTRTSRLAR